MNDDIVHGWKGIAVIIGKSIVTAWKWHNNKGLPVFFDAGGRAWSYRSKLIEYRLRIAEEQEKRRKVNNI